MGRAVEQIVAAWGGIDLWMNNGTRVGNCSVKNAPMAENTPEAKKPSGAPSTSMAPSPNGTMV